MMIYRNILTTWVALLVLIASIPAMAQGQARGAYQDRQVREPAAADRYHYQAREDREPADDLVAARPQRQEVKDDAGSLAARPAREDRQDGKVLAGEDRRQRYPFADRSARALADRDRDGFIDIYDCDDTDPEFTDGCYDQDGDGVEKDFDCDDNNAELGNEDC